MSQPKEHLAKVRPKERISGGHFLTLETLHYLYSNQKVMIQLFSVHNLTCLHIPFCL